VIEAENAPAVHDVFTGAVIAPERATAMPVSHVPVTVNAEFSYEFAAGEVNVTTGATVKRL